MAGKLDQISQAIGGLQELTKALGKIFEQHAEDDDRRHRENLETLRGIERELSDFKTAATRKSGEVHGMSRVASFVWTALIAVGSSLATLYAGRLGTPHP